MLDLGGGGVKKRLSFRKTAPLPHLLGETMFLSAFPSYT